MNSRIKTKITALAVAAVLLVSVAACGNSSPAVSGASQTPSNELAINQDREGNPITLPENIDRVIAMGPSNAEILIALGCTDKIIAADDYSSDVEGLSDDIPMFSMMSPDGEQIISLEPDVIFATGMSKAFGDDPFKVVSDAGICVIYIPASESIAEIKEDIRFIASVMGVEAMGASVVSDMERAIDEVKKKGETISDKKSVYFEIAAAPDMYSFGKGVFLNELIELIGAVNIMDDKEGWVSLTDEIVLERNPDVILTSVYYIDDPVGDILGRPGWSSITAVQNGDVCYIDANASNRPSHLIIKALNEMAAAVYPEIYGS